MLKATLLKDRVLIKLTGEPEVIGSFLQNLVTNDLNLAGTQPIYAMMLSPQGRFLFDMFIILAEDGYYLDVFAGTALELVAKLRLYKLNTKFLLEGISAEYQLCYNRVGPSPQSLFYYQDPRSSKLGFRFAIPKDTPIEETTDYYLDKYHYTIPDGGIDLLYDKAMPQEYGAEEYNAISYTKGCYIGQEVISRTKYQGVVRKKLYKITATESLANIPHGTLITAGEQKIGIFCSGYNNIGIALLRTENLEAAKKPLTLDNISITAESRY